MQVILQGRCGCSACNSFGILQVQVLVFIIGNKIKVVAPGAKGSRGMVKEDLIHEGFGFINCFSRDAANANIKRIDGKG